MWERKRKWESKRDRGYRERGKEEQGWFKGSGRPHNIWQEIFSLSITLSLQFCFVFCFFFTPGLLTLWPNLLLILTMQSESGRFVWMMKKTRRCEGVNARRLHSNWPQVVWSASWPDCSLVRMQHARSRTTLSLLPRSNSYSTLRQHCLPHTSKHVFVVKTHLLYVAQSDQIPTKMCFILPTLLNCLNLTKDVIQDANPRLWSPPACPPSA